MKNENAEQREKEQWIEEFTALKDEGQMTPKQISILEAAIEIFPIKDFRRHPPVKSPKRPA